VAVRIAEQRRVHVLVVVRQWDLALGVDVVRDPSEYTRPTPDFGKCPAIPGLSGQYFQTFAKLLGSGIDADMPGSTSTARSALPSLRPRQTPVLVALCRTLSRCVRFPNNRQTFGFPRGGKGRKSYLNLRAVQAEAWRGEVEGWARWGGDYEATQAGLRKQSRRPPFRKLDAW
jgi:hypothetical protein